ncbi:MAG: ornithine carbamoyltransferase [Treponema sp.]|jgi:ornithine carbamoyltransferase|nr:ornithine carbamoyltransferase [Treponema sp.]
MNTTSTLKGRSVLTWLDYTAAELRALLDAAKQSKAEARQGEVRQRFMGKTLALWFDERSSLTRCAFETAFGEEGGHTVLLPAHSAPEQSARALGALFNAIACRGFTQAEAERLAQEAGVPVYNGLSDEFHPTQALAAMMTLEEHCGSGGARKKLCFVGDGRSCTARSLMVLCAKLGVHFTVVTPPSLNPDAALKDRCKPLAAASGANLRITADVAEVEGADAIYTDSWAEDSKQDERVRILAPFQVNETLMKRTGRNDSIFLHSLPAITGEEVAATVLNGPQSRVWEQVKNRKHTIKSIMLATMLNM